MYMLKKYNHLYPLAKYILAKVLIPVIQTIAWIKIPRETNRQCKVVLLVNSRCNYSTPSFNSLIPELEKRGVKLEYHLVNYSKLSNFSKIKGIFYFFCQYRNADFVFLDDTFLPVSFCLKGTWFSDAYIVQLWHSCGLFKRTGLDVCSSKLSRFLGKANYKNYNLVSVSSEDCRMVIMQFMGIDIETVKALGVSRTDFYFDRFRMSQSEICFLKDYPAAVNKKVVVYAPTYRGQPFYVDTSPVPVVSDVFSKLGDEYLPFIVPHPHETVTNNAFPLNQSLSSILHLVDIFITDYSSLAMDYMIANPKGKMILFVPDIEQYNSDIGFYVELDEITDNVIFEQHELLGAILQDGELCNFIDYKDKYLNRCDGLSTQRILSYLKL